jgi:predicted SnoaL-like aldol condensation-catalyzing enzyme
MPKTPPEQNKTIALDAFDALFNKRSYEAAERYWSDHYIQHSAHIAPGRAISWLRLPSPMPFELW